MSRKLAAKPNEIPGRAAEDVLKSSRVSVARIDGLVRFMEETFPNITVQWKLHHASFRIGGKVMGFTRPEGIVLKLPQARIAELAEMRDAEFLVMGKRVMREWVLLRYAGVDDFVHDLGLFTEAMEFLRSPLGVAAKQARRKDDRL